MTERDEILKYIIDTGLADTCLQYQLRDCKNPYWREEMRSELWLWLCEYDIEKLADAYEKKHLNALITRYLQNQWKSRTSPFYKRYKKYSADMREITESEERIPDPGY